VYSCICRKNDEIAERNYEINQEVVLTIIWANVATIHDFLTNSIVQLRILLNSESELRIIQNSHCDTLMLYRKGTARYL
jgi:hypothetical protein